MSLSSEQIQASLNALAEMEPAFARGIESIGYPPPRLRDRGYQTLLRTIVGQQVSVAAANAIWAKLEAKVGAGLVPEAVAAASDELLREAGLSRQKVAYAKSLAEHVADGTIDFANLPADDEEAIAQMTAIKGIGRWSAEIYLLFAEGRGDVWPAGDLAVQIEVGKLMGLPERPSERQTRAIAAPWSPHRGAAAIFTWHSYSARLSAGKMPV
jgi:DNA-3-methyladenine glycosylase II